MIVFALSPVWQYGSQNEENRLKDIIQACLHETNERGYKSIAIPAVGTGKKNKHNT